MPRPCPPEFRRRALDLVASGRMVVEVAASLEISQALLYKWRSRELIDTGVKPGRTSEDGEELAKANKRIRELEEEFEILRKAAAAVEEVAPQEGRFALVAELAAEGVGVERACLCIGLSRSGYYERKERPPSARAIRHAWPTDLITAGFAFGLQLVPDTTDVAAHTEPFVRETLDVADQLGQIVPHGGRVTSGQAAPRRP